jgi:hypothetical protein
MYLKLSRCQLALLVLILIVSSSQSHCTLLYLHSFKSHLPDYHGALLLQRKQKYQLGKNNHSARTRIVHEMSMIDHHRVLLDLLDVVAMP